MTEGDARYQYFTYIKDLAGVDRVIIRRCAEVAMPRESLKDRQRGRSKSSSC